MPNNRVARFQASQTILSPINSEPKQKCRASFAGLQANQTFFFSGKTLQTNQERQTKSFQSSGLVMRGADSVPKTSERHRVAG